MSAMPWSEQASSNPHWSQHCWKTKYLNSGADLAKILAGFPEQHWPLPSQFSATEAHTCVHTAMHVPADTTSKTLFPHLFAFLPPHNYHFSGWSEYLQHPLGPIFPTILMKYKLATYKCGCPWCWVKNCEQPWWKGPAVHMGRAVRDCKVQKTPAWSIIWSGRNKPKSC